MDEQVEAELRYLDKRGIRANPYRAGRTMTIARHGMVSSPHLLASQAGLAMLKNGGRAMDAALVVAGVLAVTQPMMTGMGGDAFFLYYEAAGKVHGLNGSGRSPLCLTRDHFNLTGLTVRL